MNYIKPDNLETKNIQCMKFEFFTAVHIDHRIFGMCVSICWFGKSPDISEEIDVLYFMVEVIDKSAATLLRSFLELVIDWEIPNHSRSICATVFTPFWPI